MMKIDNELIMKVVQLGSAVRRCRSDGTFQSVAPPTLYGYLAMLRMCSALPHLNPQQVALSTLLGNASVRDRKQAMSVLDEVFGLRTAGENVSAMRVLFYLDFNKSETTDERVADAISSHDFYGDEPCGSSRETETQNIDSVPTGFEGTVNRHKVSTTMGGKQTGGEIFDRVIALSNDFTACEKLLFEAWPITLVLKKNRYPGIRQTQEIRKLRTSGIIDSGRLALADVSPAIFRRYSKHEMSDPKGGPLLVIACDGSGSLNRNQMKMVKVLTTAFLQSTVGRKMNILAGLYHSGHVQKGVSGPLVQWIYHSRKTTAVSSGDAVRALVSLPETGTGVQSDALSLLFIMNEAKQLAGDNMIYLILITDTAWNRSFYTEEDGEEEVCACFQGMYEKLSGKLHTTLVAVGISGDTALEEHVDTVISVPDDELKDYAAVAEKIGVYVATCIWESSKF